MKEMQNTIELHEKEFLFNPEDIEVIDKIGSGSFGTGKSPLILRVITLGVFRAKWRGTVVAGIREVGYVLIE